MTDKLNIQLVGADQLVEQLLFAAGQLDRPVELMRGIGGVMEANIQLRFDLKQDAAGQPWAPITESTKKAYGYKYPGGIPGSLLERSRHMRSSLSMNATDEFMEVGFSQDYAIHHVTGTPKMVRRDPLFGVVNQEGTQGELGAQDMQDILAEVDNFLGPLLA